MDESFKKFSPVSVDENGNIVKAEVVRKPVEGAKFWEGKIEEAGYKDVIGIYNYLVVEKDAPRLSSGYTSISGNFTLNDKKVDIYEKKDESNNWRSIYLYIKK